MATKSPTQYHNHWGAFASTADLPNVSGSSTQDSALEAGDQAFVTGDTSYNCVDPTPGAAVWNPLGAAGGVWEAYRDIGEYQYTQAETPVPEVIGQIIFNGGSVGEASTVHDVVFFALITPEFSAPGNADVRLWDLGPSGGPPSVPRLVATLNTTTDGLQYLTQVLTVVVAGPVGNQILSSERIYEITVEQSSNADDTVYVGSAGINIEVA